MAKKAARKKATRKAPPFDEKAIRAMIEPTALSHHPPRSRRLKVNVTKEIIDRSAIRDSKHCMIAEAVKEAFPMASHISVDLATVRYSDPKRRLRYTYVTPRAAQAALVNFDQEVKPDPFSFVLYGGQVTPVNPRGASRAMVKEGLRPKRKMSKKQEEALKKAQAAYMSVYGRRGKDRLSSAKSKTGNVPERIGGRTPPVQKSGDGVPFSRRRAFGLRGLKL